MKTVFLFLLSLVMCFTVIAQNDYPRYSKVAGYGFVYKRIAMDSVCLLPLLSAHVPYREGGIRYNNTDSTIELWTGYQWLKLSADAAQGLQQVTDVNNKTTDTIIAKGIRTPVLLPDTSNESDFEFIILPDLQEAAQYQPDAIRAIKNYIIDNKALNNTQSVISVGDLTNTAVDAEFMRIDSLFHSIDSMNVPSLPILGNHDYDGGVVVGGVRNVTKWNTYFPTSRFTGFPWWGGNLGSTTENYYIKFDVGSYKFLVIGLEFVPKDASLNWAQGIITANPDRKIIISTHGYMDAWGEKSTDGILLGPDAYGLGADNSGKEIWEKLIRRNKNIVMVLGGHFVNFGASTGHFHRITQAGDQGNMIHQIMINYQRHVTNPYLLGRDGYLLKMRFKPSEDKVYMSVYSPFVNTYDPQIDSFYIDLDGIKVETSLSIRDELYTRGRATMDSTVYVTKLPSNRIVYTRENGRLDTVAYQSANTVLAGPSTGSAANPTFRTLVLADIPSLSTLYIQNQSAADQVASFRINGTGIIGTALGSIAKLHLNNGGNGVTFAAGPLLSNGINNTFQSIDSITAANVGALKTVLIQGQRDIRYSDDGLSVLNSKSAVFTMVNRIKNNATLLNTAGDKNTSLQGIYFIRQYGGFAGLSTLNAPASPAEAVAAITGTVDISNLGAGSDIITANGWYSSFNAGLNSNRDTDTVQGYIGINSGIGVTLGKIKTYIHHYYNHVNADVMYANYQPGTTDSNYFVGPFRLANLSTGLSTDSILVKNNGVIKAISPSALGSSGDVVGPGSSTDNAITRYDGTTGKLIQNSTATVNDDGDISTGGSVIAGNEEIYTWAGSKSWMRSWDDGNITFTNSFGDDFDRLQFGGFTSGYPAWQRTGTTLTARLADNSANTRVSGANAVNPTDYVTLQQLTNAATNGSWSPTSTQVTNVSGVVTSAGRYTKSSNIVTCSIIVTITPTAAGTTELGLSPVSASSFAAFSEAAGTGTSETGTSGMVSADVTNSRLKFVFNAPNTTPIVFALTIQYTETAP
jgi:hypothetical protein